MVKMELHPGYNFGENFSTFGDLKKYNRMHEVEFIGLIEKLNLQNGTVVDVGCGNGLFLERLTERFPAMTAIGIDKKMYKNNLLHYVVSDARNICLNSGIADLVVSTSVSQWIPKDKGDFYNEIYRLISPKGYGLIFPCNPQDIPSNIPECNYRLRQLQKGPFKVKANQLMVCNHAAFDLGL